MNKTIRVLFGSPHKNGVTMNLVRNFLGENITNTKFIYLFNKNIKPCNDCRCCQTSSDCLIKDDMNIIYNTFENSDILIFATPVYNFSVPAPMKLVFDRTQKYFFKKRKKTDKKGYLILTSGSNNKISFITVEHQVKHVCLITGFKFIGSVWQPNTDKMDFF